MIKLSQAIWAHPETAMLEYESCRLVADFMRRQGFEVEEPNVMDQALPPNCTVATYGSGKPVICILGELDALAGLGQEAVPYEKPLEGPGHACG